MFSRKSSSLTNISARAVVPSAMIAVYLCCLASAAPANPPVDVLMYKMDKQNTGINWNEKALTPTNVNAHTFGKLFDLQVDGEVFTEPLIKTNVRIKVGSERGKHDVLYFATEHDSVYAVDAHTGSILWQDSFIDPDNGITAVPWAEVESDHNIFPEVGITGTPVIDPKLNTLFVCAETKEMVLGKVHYVQRIHAIDIETGMERPSSPKIMAELINDNNQQTYISGPTVPGTGDGNINGRITFSAMHQNQRPSLTLYNGVVYVAFSSHDDIGPYHGWILGFKEKDLSNTAAFNDTPNGGLAGIWNGASKPAFDSEGNMYFSTGNGSFDGAVNAAGQPTRADYGNSIVKLAIDPSTTPTSPGPNGYGFRVVDYFTPSDFQYQNDRDADIGSGGITLLPDSMGGPQHQQLLITGGKDSRLYLLDRNSMGGFHTDHDACIAELNGVIQRLFTSPTPFLGNVYLACEGGQMQQFSVANGVISPKPITASSQWFGFPGATGTISANGSQDAILWSLDRSSNSLIAFDVANFPKVVYTSNDDSNDSLGVAVRFTAPTPANGLVYAGTENSVVCYGLLPTARLALNKPSTMPSVIAPHAPIKANAIVKGHEVDLTWTNVATNATSYVILRKTGSAGTYITLAVLPPTATSYNDTNMIQSQTDYEYHIEAVNSAGNSDFAGFLAHVP